MEGARRKGERKRLVGGLLGIVRPKKFNASVEAPCLGEKSCVQSGLQERDKIDQGSNAAKLGAASAAREFIPNPNPFTYPLLWLRIEITGT